MLAEIIIALFLGIVFGTFTGLIPGIHINLIGVFIVSLSASILIEVEPILLVIFITAMAITHTFVDFIPSIFLGCPDTDTELAVLPGHELLKKGQGHQAVVLSAYGSAMAIITLILISFPFVLIISSTYDFIRTIIPYLLIIISIFLILLEKRKASALLVFLLTGLLGWSVLNLPNLEQPLLPLLTGLFGSSMLVMSIKNKIKIPKQEIEKPSLKNPKQFAGAFLGSLIASPLCSFLPGLGSGQAAIIGNTISGSKKQADKKQFLVLLGATNTLVMGFSLIVLYKLSKTRTGAAVAIKEILPQVLPSHLALIFLAIILSSIIAFFLTIFLSKIFSQKISKINYTKISLTTLFILAVIVFLISGILGLAVLTASTLTGIYCISLKIRRTNMMGCLLIPTIILYLS